MPAMHAASAKLRSGQLVFAALCLRRAAFLAEPAFPARDTGKICGERQLAATGDGCRDGDDALSELDRADRGLIEGKYLDGASVKELAEQTGTTEKTVESRLLRLRKRLRELILERLESL